MLTFEHWKVYERYSFIYIIKKDNLKKINFENNNNNDDYNNK